MGGSGLGKFLLSDPRVSSTMLNSTYDTPMVVIIAAGPTTPRNGRSRNRSIPTPMHPHTTMDTANPAASTPTSGRPVRMVSWPTSPNDCSVSMATIAPTMKTLKCAKLISSAMP